MRSRAGRPQRVNDGRKARADRRALHDLDLNGRSHRIYFEEAGQGIPLVCLHTAGADGRQFRHLMLDNDVTRRFRVLAFDMPWHGKSLPPEGWQKEEYRLTTVGLYFDDRRFLPGSRSRATCRHGMLDRRPDRSRTWRLNMPDKVPALIGLEAGRTFSRPGTIRPGSIVRTFMAEKFVPHSSRG